MGFKEACEALFNEGKPVVFVARFDAEYGVWFTEDVEPINTIVQDTPAFETWWKLLQFPCNRVLLDDAIEKAVEVEDFREARDPGLEYSIEEDAEDAKQVYLENAYELLNEEWGVELHRHDHKRGHVEGTWAMWFDFREYSEEARAIIDIIQSTKGFNVSLGGYAYRI